MWARYTASGGAAKRRVTTTWVSPSVLSVSLLIVFLLTSFLVFPCRPEACPAGRNSFSALFGASRAIGPWLRRPPLQGDGGAWSHPRGAPPVPHLRGLSSAGRPPVESSRRV